MKRSEIASGSTCRAGHSVASGCPSRRLSSVGEDLLIHDAFPDEQAHSRVPPLRSQAPDAVSLLRGQQGASV